MYSYDVQKKIEDGGHLETLENLGHLQYPKWSMSVPCFPREDISSCKEGVNEKKLIGWKKFSSLDDSFLYALNRKLHSRLICWFDKSSFTASVAMHNSQFEGPNLGRFFAHNIKIRVIRPIKITDWTTPHGDLSFDTLFAKICQAVSEKIFGQCLRE